ncbi:hypothetical protein [Haladaptatus salinisoli]|nr:hypothetical protein [Haladaptatus salinisoli]
MQDVPVLERPRVEQPQLEIVSQSCEHQEPIAQQDRLHFAAVFVSY